jgi:hypothetical protein
MGIPAWVAYACPCPFLDAMRWLAMLDAATLDALLELPDDAPACRSALVAVRRIGCIARVFYSPDFPKSCLPRY